MRALTKLPCALLCLLATACASSDRDAAADPTADGPADDDGSLAQQASADVCGVATARPRNLTLRGNLGTHDPVIIAAGGRYWEYQTGKFVYAKVSNDLVHWDPLPSQFPRLDCSASVSPITDYLWRRNPIGGSPTSITGLECSTAVLGHAPGDSHGSWKMRTASSSNTGVRSSPGTHDPNAADSRHALDELRHLLERHQVFSQPMKARRRRAHSMHLATAAHRSPSSPTLLLLLPFSRSQVLRWPQHLSPMAAPTSVTGLLDKPGPR